MNTKDLILIIAAILGPLLTYLVAARRLSGRIKNSEASSLWAESASIREWSANRAKQLEEKLEKLEERLATVETLKDELLAENRELRSKCDHLTERLEAEKEFNARLRWDAEHSPRRRRTDEHLTTNGDEP